MPTPTRTSTPGGSGPADRTAVIDRWDATDGGAFRFLDSRDDDQQAFRGCFHTVRPDRIVQTFTWEGMPDDVALETLTFEDLGDGRTRLHALSLCDSLRGSRRLAAQRHGDRRQRRVRRDRPDAGRWLPLSSSRPIRPDDTG